MIITNITVEDVRVPTSDTLLGSDPFHRKPDYSAVVIKVETDSDLVGHSLVFNIGAGNDWLAYGVKDLAILIVGLPLKDFSNSPNAIYERLIDHHQMRWLADGVFRMAAGGLLNALWDLWAKQQEKPLWELLADLTPEQIVACVNWRYLKDALTPDEALHILHQQRANIEEQSTISHYRTCSVFNLRLAGSDRSPDCRACRKTKTAGFQTFQSQSRNKPAGRYRPAELSQNYNRRRRLSHDRR